MKYGAADRGLRLFLFRHPEWYNRGQSKTDKQNNTKPGGD
ncbi:hypothetical protein HMPREF9413_2083 [Paenibacillus sp. HGF7]|nr:hypothetical protein HMPREF9413_2083 [Paenibacillus sp. HGF7]